MTWREKSIQTTCTKYKDHKRANYAFDKITGKTPHQTQSMPQKTNFTNNDCEEQHYGHQTEKGIDNCSDHDGAPVYNNSPASVALIPIAERSATRISKSAISIATSLHTSCLPHRGTGEQGRKPILRFVCQQKTGEPVTPSGLAASSHDETRNA